MGLGLGPRRRTVRVNSRAHFPNRRRRIRVSRMLVGLDVILGLLVAVAALALLARKISIPYPILLVLGGLVLALIPGLPAIQLSRTWSSCSFCRRCCFRRRCSRRGGIFTPTCGPSSLLAVGTGLVHDVFGGFFRALSWSRDCRSRPLLFWARLFRRPTPWRPRPSPNVCACRDASSPLSKAKAW